MFTIQFTARAYKFALGETVAQARPRLPNSTSIGVACTRFDYHSLLFRDVADIAIAICGSVFDSVVKYYRLNSSSRTIPTLKSFVAGLVTPVRPGMKS
jgi:hypothetical protein